MIILWEHSRYPPMLRMEDLSNYTIKYRDLHTTCNNISKCFDDVSHNNNPEFQYYCYRMVHSQFKNWLKRSPIPSFFGPLGCAIAIV